MVNKEDEPVWLQGIDYNALFYPNLQWLESWGIHHVLVDVGTSEALQKRVAQNICIKLLLNEGEMMGKPWQTNHGFAERQLLVIYGDGGLFYKGNWEIENGWSSWITCIWIERFMQLGVQVSRKITIYGMQQMGNSLQKVWGINNYGKIVVPSILYPSNPLKLTKT